MSVSQLAARLLGRGWVAGCRLIPVARPADPAYFTPAHDVPISKSGSSGAPTVSIVVPIYDEELVIEALHSRLQRFAGATK
jgi:hypothetical protein